MLDLFNFSLRFTTKRPILWRGRGHFSSLFTLRRMEEGKRALPHPPVVLLFTPARRQYHKSKDICDTGGAFLLIEINFARSKSFSVHFSISLVGGKKGFFSLRKQKLQQQRRKSAFFWADCGESAPQSHLSGRFWQNEETFSSDWTSSRENTFHMYCILHGASGACSCF